MTASPSVLEPTLGRLTLDGYLVGGRSAGRCTGSSGLAGPLLRVLHGVAHHALLGTAQLRRSHLPGLGVEVALLGPQVRVCDVHGFPHTTLTVMQDESAFNDLSL